MGAFNTLVGIAYMISPFDAIPDFVPLVGTIDDTLLGAGMAILGASSFYKAKLREITTDNALQSINDGNNIRAIQLLLKDKGVELKDKVKV